MSTAPFSCLEVLHEENEKVEVENRHAPGVQRREEVAA
jgi:hypothetical protein